MLIQYNIKDTDVFDVKFYPEIVKEVEDLGHRLFNIASDQKAFIVISLVKDHSIKTVLLNTNRELVRMVQSSGVRTSQMESLFASCRGNRDFVNGLETYIGLVIK
jgi:hypothetical protein